MKTLMIASLLSLSLAAPLAAQNVEASVTGRLMDYGYNDVMVSPDGNHLRISATRDGIPHRIVYSPTTGTFTEVDNYGYSMGTPPGIPPDADPDHGSY